MSIVLRQLCLATGQFKVVTGKRSLEEQRKSILEDLGRISGTMSGGNNNMKELV